MGFGFLALQLFDAELHTRKAFANNDPYAETARAALCESLMQRGDSILPKLTHIIEVAGDVYAGHGGRRRLTLSEALRLDTIVRTTGLDVEVLLDLIKRLQNDPRYLDFNLEGYLDLLSVISTNADPVPAVGEIPNVGLPQQDRPSPPALFDLPEEVPPYVQEDYEAKKAERIAHGLVFRHLTDVSPADRESGKPWTEYWQHGNVLWSRVFTLEELAAKWIEADGNVLGLPDLWKTAMRLAENDSSLGLKWRVASKLDYRNAAKSSNLDMGGTANRQRILGQIFKEHAERQHRIVQQQTGKSTGVYTTHFWTGDAYSDSFAHLFVANGTFEVVRRCDRDPRIGVRFVAQP